MGRSTQNQAAAPAPVEVPDAPTAPPSAPAAAPDPAPAPALVKARVLCAGPWGKVNDVVEVTEAEAKDHASLDAHPDAVAYAESLKQAPEGDQA